MATKYTRPLGIDIVSQPMTTGSARPLTKELFREMIAKVQSQADNWVPEPQVRMCSPRAFKLHGTEHENCGGLVECLGHMIVWCQECNDIWEVP